MLNFYLIFFVVALVLSFSYDAISYAHVLENWHVLQRSIRAKKLMKREQIRKLMRIRDLKEVKGEHMAFW